MHSLQLSSPRCCTSAPPLKATCARRVLATRPSLKTFGSGSVKAVLDTSLASQGSYKQWGTSLEPLQSESLEASDSGLPEDEGGIKAVGRSGVELVPHGLLSTPSTPFKA